MNDFTRPESWVQHMPDLSGAKIEEEDGVMDKEQWGVTIYQSGTHIVTRNNPTKPHYYVHADDRRKVCVGLKEWLNGGESPEWRKSLRRSGKESVTGPNGIDIYATGPFILPPDDNGALNWGIDPAKELDRVELIDRLINQ